eukprot:scaffold1963_cov89-Skeletonema_dohrnii-CCMP3373.AAC.3
MFVGSAALATILTARFPRWEKRSFSNDSNTDKLSDGSEGNGCKDLFRSSKLIKIKKVCFLRLSILRCAASAQQWRRSRRDDKDLAQSQDTTLFYASKTDDGDQTFDNSTTITLKELE